MKLRKTLAVLSAIAAGSTMIFGQAVSVQAEDVVIEETSVSSEVAPAEEAAAPVEEATAPAEEAAAPVEEVAAPAEEAAAPVEEAAAPVEGTTTPDEEIETLGTVTTVAVDSMYDEYATQTTTVAVAVEGTTTTATTIPYLDTDIYSAVDVNSDAGKTQLADKDIDYDKIYNDFLYNVVVPNTEGGISSVTEGDKAQSTAYSENSGKDERVYSEMLGIFAATVHDFCNDSIPELITVTNSMNADDFNGEYYPSRITYDLWQYNKADDTIHKISTVESGTNLPIMDNAVNFGKVLLKSSVNDYGILEEGYASGGGVAYNEHAYILYKINDDYSFNLPVVIDSYNVQVDKDTTQGSIEGYIGENLSSREFTSEAEIKQLLASFGIEADVKANLDPKNTSLEITNVKGTKKLYDYSVEQKGDMHYNLTDYTGVHGKTSSAPASTNGKTGNESAKAANKNDSPKTGVAFPIAAAGTGAAALALAAAAVVSKKKKD